MPIPGLERTSKGKRPLGLTDRLCRALMGSARWRQRQADLPEARLTRQLDHTHRRLCLAEAKLALLAQGRTPRAELVFRSQSGEDALLWSLLGGQTTGFYIEAGAYDGLTFSVSAAFDALGWDGLLVEALPEHAQACRAARPHARVEHAALARAGATGTATFSVVPEGEDQMLSGLARSLDPGAAGKSVRTFEVPLTSLSVLLGPEPRAIDFAVFDVEGAEVDLLDGLDFARHAPRVMLIEDNTASDASPLARAMRERPYTQVGWLGVNRVYVRSDQREILARARD